MESDENKRLSSPRKRWTGTELLYFLPKWCKQLPSANLLFTHCPRAWCLAAWQGFSETETLSSWLHLLLPWENCLCAYSSIAEHPLWPDTKPFPSVHWTHLYLGLVSSVLGALQATSQTTSNKKQLMKMWCSTPSVARLPFLCFAYELDGERSPSLPWRCKACSSCFEGG